MDKLKILVAIHKEAEVFHNDIYQPIWAGKAISKANLQWPGDDIGDEISRKNRNYSEMTVHYWAWKNLQTEYIGFCHYRRYFSTCFTSKNIENELRGYDILLPNAMYFDTPMYEKLCHTFSLEDKDIFLLVLKQKFPFFYKAAIDYLFNNRKDYAFNMMVCKKTIFDDMMNFVFSVLFECEKYVKISPYTTSSRVFGYYAEYLVPIYCFAKHLKIREMSLTDMLGTSQQNIILAPESLKRRIQSKLRFKFMHPKQTTSYSPYPAVLVGLYNDGIINDKEELISQ